MTLIEKQMVPCRRMIRVSTDDAFGGHRDTLSPGAKFPAFIRKDSSPEIQVAEKSGLSEFYTVVFYRKQSLVKDDIIRRESDGALFRISSNATDSEAPDPSTVKIAKVTAERWVLPQ